MCRIGRFVVLSLLLSSCNMFDYHPYDGNTDINNINNENIQRIVENTKNKEEFSFIWMGDSQRAYDETEDFVKYVNKNCKIDFVLHGGDLTDFGMTDEFEINHEIMTKLKVPYVALIGNHDIVGTGEYVFKQMYGDTDFSFTVSNVKFICLNTNKLEYDNDANIPNFNYISSEINKKANPARTIGVMHAPPGSEQLDLDTGKKLHTKLKEFNNLMFCLNAHVHRTAISDLFEDGITYYQCATIAKRSFFIFTITKNSYEYEEILF